ncbi:UNVERIFIED_CONTAM: hypothetical protein Slati_0555900 [Sesamum latifolium]|uniref:Uncharacterized protein n=1 Tax=Sesamum latifolium TaxID=2727402 RepID=A0AAW2Y0E9_9LAMI
MWFDLSAHYRAQVGVFNTADSLQDGAAASGIWVDTMVFDGLWLVAIRATRVESGGALTSPAFEKEAQGTHSWGRAH